MVPARGPGQAVLKKIPGRVVSGQEVFENLTSRVGSGSG